MTQKKLSFLRKQHQKQHFFARTVRYLVFLVAFAGSLTLTACGFSPLYGSQSPIKQSLLSLSLGEVSGRNARQVRKALLLEFPSSEHTQYRLMVALKVRTVPKGININDIASRRDYILEAESSVYTLKNTLLFTHKSSVITSYSVPASPYGALNASQDAERRAVQALVEQIRLDLAKSFLDRQKRKEEGFRKSSQSSLSGKKSIK